MNEEKKVSGKECVCVPLTLDTWAIVCPHCDNVQEWPMEYAIFDEPREEPYTCPRCSKKYTLKINQIIALPYPEIKTEEKGFKIKIEEKGILLPCPRCGNVMDVGVDYLDESATCIRCGKDFQAAIITKAV